MKEIDKNNEKIWFKVLDGKGQSRSGGRHTWSLPTKVGRRWTPGGWHSVHPNLVQLCTGGFHVTDKPQTWARVHNKNDKKYFRLFLCEISGKTTHYTVDGYKIAAERCRLLKEIPLSLMYVGYKKGFNHGYKHRAPSYRRELSVGRRAHAKTAVQ
jgi:hypothetical protein